MAFLTLGSADAAVASLYLEAFIPSCTVRSYPCLVASLYTSKASMALPPAIIPPSIMMSILAFDSAAPTVSETDNLRDCHASSHGYQTGSSKGMGQNQDERGGQGRDS